MDEQKVTISFETSKDMYDRLARLANADERPMSYVIRKAVLQYFDTVREPASFEAESKKKGAK